MTISATTNRNDYTGNGTADTFAYSFKIFAESDLVVIVTDSSDVETTLTITTDYTVTGVGDSSGGNVVLVDASQAWVDAEGDLDTGYTLTIRRIRPLTQGTDIRNQGDFFPEAHENAFDHLIMIDQQQQEEIDRTIKLPVSNTTTSTDIGAAVNDAYLGYNSDSTSIVSKVPTSLEDSGPTINGGDAEKIVKVNAGETAYELASFKSIMEAITTGGLTFNTDITSAAEITMSSKIFRGAKGADVASGTSIALGDDGNYFDITGTTDIQTITIKTSGTMVTLQFDGVLELVDSTGNLELRGFDMQTYAGFVVTLVSDGTNWLLVGDYAMKGNVKIHSGTVASIELGWQICDGTNGSPDLTGHFVMHADADSGGTHNVGETPTMTSAHTHIQDAHNHGITTNDASRSSPHGVETVNATQQNNTSYIANETATNQSTGSQTGYALAYIIRL